MLNEQEIRKIKSNLLRYIESCNNEIAKHVSDMEELKSRIHESESKLKVIKDVLED